MTVRLNPALSEFVASNVQQGGTYENVSEYVRDLIRRDMVSDPEGILDHQVLDALSVLEVLAYQPMGQHVLAAVGRVQVLDEDVGVDEDVSAHSFRPG